MLTSLCLPRGPATGHCILMTAKGTGRPIYFSSGHGHPMGAWPYKASSKVDVPDSISCFVRNASISKPDVNLLLRVGSST